MVHFFSFLGENGVLSLSFFFLFLMKKTVFQNVCIHLLFLNSKFWGKIHSIILKNVLLFTKPPLIDETRIGSRVSLHLCAHSRVNDISIGLYLTSSPCHSSLRTLACFFSASQLVSLDQNQAKVLVSFLSR